MALNNDPSNFQSNPIDNYSYTVSYIYVAYVDVYIEGYGFKEL